MDEQTLQQQLQILTENVQSMQLATLSKTGEPDISYAPFIKLGNRFYLFLSDLAKHSGNIQRQPTFNFMLIEDEANAKQIFARTRLICSAKASVVPSDKPIYGDVLDQFESRFGNVMTLLRSLSDFKLFELQVLKGSLVLGFGQAYSFEGDEFGGWTHLRENR